MTIISTPIELITAVPFLLNEYPSETLVAISLRAGAVECVSRAKIPKNFEIGCDEEFFYRLGESSPEELLLLAYLPVHYDENSINTLCTQIRNRCQGFTQVRDFLVIWQGRWRSFDCSDLKCCTRLGQVLPDIQSSALAAEHVFQGLPMPSTSAPDGPAQLSPSGEISSQLLEQARSEVERSDAALRSKRGVVTLLRLITAFTISKSFDDVPLLLAARALVAFTDIQVRDFAIGAHGDENLELHRELFSQLLEIAPVGYRAPVATVLALLHYEAGAASKARTTLEGALCDDPHYSLAHLLQKSFSAGWPPEAFTTMRHELHPKLSAELLG